MLQQVVILVILVTLALCDSNDFPQSECVKIYNIWVYDMPPWDFASNSFSFGSDANSSNAAFEQGLQPNQERHETDIKNYAYGRQ